MSVIPDGMDLYVTSTLMNAQRIILCVVMDNVLTTKVVIPVIVHTDGRVHIVIRISMNVLIIIFVTTVTVETLMGTIHVTVTQDMKDETVCMTLTNVR